MDFYQIKAHIMITYNLTAHLDCPLSFPVTLVPISPRLLSDIVNSLYIPSCGILGTSMWTYDYLDVQGGSLMHLKGLFSTWCHIYLPCVMHKHTISMHAQSNTREDLTISDNKRGEMGTRVTGNERVQSRWAVRLYVIMMWALVWWKSIKYVKSVGTSCKHTYPYFRSTCATSCAHTFYRFNGFPSNQSPHHDQI